MTFSFSGLQGAVASADERKKAKEVIEAVILIYVFPRCTWHVGVRKGVLTRVIVRCGGCVRWVRSGIFRMGLHAGIRGKFLWWVSRTDGGWLVFSFN